MPRPTIIQRMPHETLALALRYIGKCSNSTRHTRNASLTCSNAALELRVTCGGHSDETEIVNREAAAGLAGLDAAFACNGIQTAVSCEGLHLASLDGWEWESGAGDKWAAVGSEAVFDFWVVSLDRERGDE